MPDEEMTADPAARGGRVRGAGGRPRPGDRRLAGTGPGGRPAARPVAGRVRGRRPTLAREALAELDALPAGAADDPAERACARLLRERLTAQLLDVRGRRTHPRGGQLRHSGAPGAADLHHDADRHGRGMGGGGGPVAQRAGRAGRIPPARSPRAFDAGCWPRPGRPRWWSANSPRGPARTPVARAGSPSSSRPAPKGLRDRTRRGRAPGDRGGRRRSATGCATTTRRPPRGPRTRSAGSATCCWPATPPAPTWTCDEAYEWAWTQFHETAREMRAGRTGAARRHAGRRPGPT